MNLILKMIWNSVFATTGIDLSFGARYFDWSFYLIELKAYYQGVKELLADTRFDPIQYSQDETRLQIIGCDMRHVQIVGSYHEISIQVPIHPLNNQSGQYFAHLYLPVNSEAARWAGGDITGFPKFLAMIERHEMENQVKWQLYKDSSLILSFSIPDQIGQHDQFTWHYYGLRKKRMILTSFELEGKVLEQESNPDASIQLGYHPVGDSLRKQLISEEICRTLIGHQVSGFLNKPVEVE